MSNILLFAHPVIDRDWSSFLECMLLRVCHPLYDVEEHQGKFHGGGAVYN